MAYCKHCGGVGKFWREKLDKKKHFSHDAPNRDCNDYINRRFRQQHWRPTFESFTQPTRCEACGKQCFRWNDENERPFLFDELGPPWPKHDHNRQQEKVAGSRWQWEVNGYVPCYFENGQAFFDGDKRPDRLLIWVRDLKTSSSLSVWVCRKDIRRIVKQRHQPFLFKIIAAQLLELNTFDNDCFKSRLYECSLTQPQWPPPPVQIGVFEPWGRIFT